MTQGWNQLNLFNRNLPMVITGSGTPNRIPGVQYQEIPELITSKPFDFGDGKQVGYKLPDGTYTSNPELVNIAKQNIAKSRAMAATKAVKGATATGGLTGLVTAPIAYLGHKDAIKYYDDIINDPNTKPEHKQLANAMKIKEQVQMATEGIGIPVGAGLGTLVTKHPKVGSFVGGAIPEALSSGFGYFYNKALEPAIQQYGFQPYNGGVKLGGLMSGDNSSESNKSPQSTKYPQQDSNTKTQVRKTTSNAYTIPQQPDGVTTEQQPNINVINDYIQQLKDVNQPYVDALQNYLNNYNDLYKRNYNTQRYWAAMSGLANNPRYANVANAYNPLVQEANRLNAIKQLQQAQTGDINAINEVMGNIAIAKELDLPYEAAFANKNLLTALTANRRNLTDWEKAQLAAELKRYGIDVGYSKAMNQQALRNQGAMDRAILNAQVYGYGGYQPAPGLTQQGQARPPMAINQIQSQNDIASLFPPKK